MELNGKEDYFSSRFNEFRVNSFCQTETKYKNKDVAIAYLERFKRKVTQYQIKLRFDLIDIDKYISPTALCAGDNVRITSKHLTQELDRNFKVADDDEIIQAVDNLIRSIELFGLESESFFIRKIRKFGYFENLDITDIQFGISRDFDLSVTNGQNRFEAYFHPDLFAYKETIEKLKAKRDFVNLDRSLGRFKTDEYSTDDTFFKL